MAFSEYKILEILKTLPSEGPGLDYKKMPYTKNKKSDFIKDVIAMLNAEAVMDEDKFIIFGIDDSKSRVGIEAGEWHDDNEWQNLLEKIVPRPIDVRTGTVYFEEKLFGYIYISPLNDEWVYEAGETFLPERGEKVKETNTLFKGQALTRKGSTNAILFSKDRQRLMAKKRIMRREEQPPVITISSDVNVNRLLSLIGEWNENYEGDGEIVEKLSGTHATSIVEKLRETKAESPTAVAFSNGIWKTKSHKDILIKEAENIYDEHIETFFEVAKACFTDVEPKYSLEQEKRYAPAIYAPGETSRYSKGLRRGIAETIAILGNNSEAFTNCSRGKITSEIYRFEENFFNAEDWRVFASEAENLQFLGEAYPKVFVEGIIEKVSKKNKAFLKFLNEKEYGITTTQYGYQLSWVLSDIAKLEEQFSSAMFALFKLAEINESFSDTIVGIVLPWYPQTHASVKSRVGIFNELAKENIELTWKILMKLMPRATTTSSPIHTPIYLQVAEIPEKVNNSEYIAATRGYIEVALNIMGTDAQKMCDLFPIIDDVDEELQQKIISKIGEGAAHLSQTEKEKLWNVTQDFVLRHRKFADAKWALKEERLREVELFADNLLPDSSYAMAKRLFRQNQYTLFEEVDNYEAEAEKLKNKREEVLKKIYEEKGIEGLISFAAEVEDSFAVGATGSQFLRNEEIANTLHRDTLCENSELTRGIFLNINFERAIEIIQPEPDGIKAEILSFLPLTSLVIGYVEGLNDASRELFWKRTPVWGIGTDASAYYETAVNNLNMVRRTDRSIFLLFDCVKNGLNVDAQLVADTLQLNVEFSVQCANTLGKYYAQELIKWLQSRNVARDTMIRIEWEYLVFLGDIDECAPINLWNELSSNPDFYIDVLKLIYGKSDSFDGTEEELSKIAEHCYTLMFGWEKVPGLCDDGTIDETTLDKWMTEVVEKGKKFDLYGPAMSYFGKAAFHAPEDKDGFFINRSIAGYLQSDADGHARSGYHLEAINSRGVHTVDITGEAEFAIEAEYRKKATAADEEGMFRLAKTLREIADSYHEEGEHNKEYGQL